MATDMFFKLGDINEKVTDLFSLVVPSTIHHYNQPAKLPSKKNSYFPHVSGVGNIVHAGGFGLRRPFVMLGCRRSSGNEPAAAP